MRKKLSIFFCKLHSVEAIIKDLEQGSVKIFLKGNKIVATGSRTGNHITRVFVAPEEQGRGFGTLIMNKLESEIAAEGFHIAHLETSLPRKVFVGTHLADGFHAVCRVLLF